MKANAKRKRDRLGQEMIEAYGIDMMEAAQIIHELAGCLGTGETLDAQECLRVLRKARGVLREANPKLTLAQGAERLLEAKKHRRAATRRELAYFTKKLIAHNPEIAVREIRHITTEMCRVMLERTFCRKSMRCKARTILHGLFAFCCRRGWTERNPVDALPKEPVTEREIEPLSLEEIGRLLGTSLLAEHLACAPAVGIMLWCGIRPAEVTRLRWRDVHFDTRTITVNSAQSKTGGTRCVSMPAPLIHWLRRFRVGKKRDERICPRSWAHRWGALHRAGGLNPWRRDVLRHTFASCHAMHFRDLGSLQLEMGHRSTQMLRFRYVSLAHFSRKAAACFWSARYWKQRIVGGKMCRAKGGKNEVPGGEGGKENDRRGQEGKPSTRYEVEIRRNSVAQGGRTQSGKEGAR